MLDTFEEGILGSSISQEREMDSPYSILFIFWMLNIPDILVTTINKTPFWKDANTISISSTWACLVWWQSLKELS